MLSVPPCARFLLRFIFTPLPRENLYAESRFMDFPGIRLISVFRHCKYLDFLPHSFSLVVTVHTKRTQARQGAEVVHAGEPRSKTKVGQTRC